MNTKTLLLTIPVALAACAAEPDAPASSASGKADAVSPTGAADACTQAHDAWLLNDYAPLACSDGPACVGKAALESKPSCDGGPSMFALRAVSDKHVDGPILARLTAARNRFFTQGVADAGDRAAYVRNAMPTEAEQQAHAKLLPLFNAAAVDNSAFHYIEWLEGYKARIRLAATALPHRQHAAAGRLVCEAGIIDASDAQTCLGENAYALNRAEQRLLDMYEATRPRRSLGAYEAWSHLYLSMLPADGPRFLLEFAGQAPAWETAPVRDYERAFMQRLRGTAPVVDDTSTTYITTYLVTLFFNQFPPATPALEFAEAGLPTRLTGVAQYRAWVELGVGELADNLNLRAQLLKAKPCAQTDEDLAAFTNIATAAALSPDVLAWAGPKRCE